MSDADRHRGRDEGNPAEGHRVCKLLDAIKLIALAGLERCPSHPDLPAYPHQPKMDVRTTAADDDALVTWRRRHLLECRLRWRSVGRDARGRPKVSPRRTSGLVEEVVLALRRANPAWGGRKIRRTLSRGTAVAAVPAASTITGILRRNGLLERETPSPEPFKRFEAEAPNLLWQMDFKGHFALDGRIDGKGERCFPLTVLDDHSRYLLGAKACADETAVTVHERLGRVFKEHGLPDAMIADNGNPYPSARIGGQQNGPTRLTRLSVWLIRLGIRPLWSRPRHPQTIGKIERLHRTLKAELLQGRRFGDVEAAQAGLDRWRRDYNHERPHKSLDGEVPSSRYGRNLANEPALDAGHSPRARVTRR